MRALILTVLAPFKNRERTYTDSTCPISEPWAHLSWQCLPHFKTVSALILTVCAPFQKCERTYSDSACPILMMMKWCLMSLDVSWHIRDKFVTNAEGRFNIALRPRKPEGSLGRTAQDVHLDSHIAPELCCPILEPWAHLYWQCLPHFRTVSALILTVLAPFQNREHTYTDSTCPISNRERTYTDSVCPISELWAHSWARRENSVSGMTATKGR